MPYERKINYYETDKMGIVHHSNYIRYMEEARLYYMDKLGFSYKSVEDLGLIIPVLAVEVKYIQALRYGDKIHITVSFEKKSRIKHSVLYEIRNIKTGTLNVIARSEHCFLDKDMQPVRLDKVYPTLECGLNRLF